MKQLFLGGMVAIAVIAGFGYLLWLTGAQLWADWKLNREVKEIQREMQVIRQQRAENREAERQQQVEDPAATE